jgi:hypothetical protein
MISNPDQEMIMPCHTIECRNKSLSRAIPRGVWCFTLLLLVANAIALAQRWSLPASEMTARIVFVMSLQIIGCGVLATILLLGVLMHFAKPLSSTSPLKNTFSPQGQVAEARAELGQPQETAAQESSVPRTLVQIR